MKADTRDFYDDLGEHFYVLDELTKGWPLAYREQPLRPLWDRIGLDIKRHWVSIYPRFSGEADVLAHMVARVLQEMADHLGDDDRCLSALKAAVNGNVGRGSTAERTLEEVLGQWGDAVMMAVFPSVREAIFGLRPEKL